MTTRRQWANVAVFQAAWFAAVLSAAQQQPAWGTACIGVAVAWHLAISAQPAREAALVACVTLFGLAIETATAPLGLLTYAGHAPGLSSPSWPPYWPPYWLVALWSLFAITLNVTLRWLKRRPWWAALLGAVAGPMSFAGGVRLGAADFTSTELALAVLAVQWAVAMPVLMWLSGRFDGVVAARLGSSALPEASHV